MLKVCAFLRCPRTNRHLTITQTYFFSFVWFLVHWDFLSAVLKVQRWPKNLKMNILAHWIDKSAKSSVRWLMNRWPFKPLFYWELIYTIFTYAGHFTSYLIIWNIKKIIVLRRLKSGTKDITEIYNPYSLNETNGQIYYCVWKLYFTYIVCTLEKNKLEKSYETVQ